MKKIYTYLFVLAMVGIYTVVHAQNNEMKEVKTTIMIHNGDTIVNGKNFKNLAETEKAELRKNFNGMNQKVKLNPNPGHYNESRVMIVKNIDGKDSISLDSAKMRTYSFNGNDDKVMVEIEKNRMMDGMPTENRNYREMLIAKDEMNNKMNFEMMPPRNGNFERIRINNPNRPNTNVFNYTTTDKAGFTTQIQYVVAQPNPIDLKENFKNQDIPFDALAINEVMLVPNFASGKTTLTFNSDIKGLLNIKLIDANGQTLFAEQKPLVNNSYSKQFVIAKNGLYFLQISQGNKTFIRKIVRN